MSTWSPVQFFNYIVLIMENGIGKTLERNKTTKVASQLIQLSLQIKTEVGNIFLQTIFVLQRGAVLASCPSKITLRRTLAESKTFASKLSVTQKRKVLSLSIKWSTRTQKTYKLFTNCIERSSRVHNESSRK